MLCTYSFVDERWSDQVLGLTSRSIQFPNDQATECLSVRVIGRRSDTATQRPSDWFGDWFGADRMAQGSSERVTKRMIARAIELIFALWCVLARTKNIAQKKGFRCFFCGAGGRGNLIPGYLSRDQGFQRRVVRQERASDREILTCVKISSDLARSRKFDF